VDIINKIIYFYDSVYNVDRGTKFIDATFRWLNEEHYKIIGVELPRDTWTSQILIDIPQQDNGNDCGVYLLLFADYRSDDIDIRLIQNIPFQRRRIARNILAGNLFYPPF
jgi:sentrin-specific protease 1